MNDHQTAQDILNELSPEGMKLAKRVLELERENLHIKSPTILVSKVVEAAKELAK
ncbi:hypothetical protein [Streptomyces narbonensis]|uniref:hypothetical protein n=1 Tax=Streptomyces narbonensis TaxID=67333 RepID=UPI00167B30F1|nr:hypothetical protein [Streptomyces narbonensis]GGV99969.1 hypothetical protein GCM10010230_26980 [Streptomyces narbonensis]